MERKEARPKGKQTVVGGTNVVDAFDEVERLSDLEVEEGGVAEVVRLHDGRVERGEIKRRDGDVVVSRFGFENHRSLVLIVRTFLLERRDDVAVLEGFAVELRDDLGLLTAREQVLERDPGDTRHLDVVDEAHELVHETLGEVGVLRRNRSVLRERKKRRKKTHLQAVDCKTTPRLSVTVLQVRNDRVVDVLLLLACTRSESSISVAPSTKKGKKGEKKLSTYRGNEHRRSSGCRNEACSRAA
jgi:hypothetical protein